VGIYRKRLLSGHKAYYTHKEFCKHVEGADVKKSAKMLRILSFLTQTKVYLFWRELMLIMDAMRALFQSFLYLNSEIIIDFSLHKFYKPI